jgi:hypothetical protein
MLSSDKTSNTILKISVSGEIHPVVIKATVWSRHRKTVVLIKDSKEQNPEPRTRSGPSHFMLAAIA